MFTAIGLFFSSVMKMIANIFKWCVEHPKQTAIIVAVILIIGSTWYVTRKYTTKAVWKEANVVISKLQGEVAKANKDAKDRDEKIARIERESREKADALDKALLAAGEERKIIITDYETKLKLEKGKYKVVTVKDPNTGKDVDVNFNPAGQVVCSRFSDAYVEAVNKLVDVANKPLKLTMSTTLTIAGVTK